MATESKTYPKLSRKMWWLVRDRFKKTLPTVVTPMLIQSISDMNEASARSNVMAPFREIGLLDADNKPTDLASRWRDDTEYSAVCREIRDKVYPKDLVEAFPDGSATNSGPVISWFMRAGKVGEPAAKMYMQLYQLLSEADLAKREETKAKNGAAPSEARTRSEKSKKEKQANTDSQSRVPPLPIQNVPPTGSRFPSVHVDLQIHISPDTSPDQIDKIFESMAKHLGAFNK